MYMLNPHSIRQIKEHQIVVFATSALLDRISMDFNSLLRLHLQGEEGRVQIPSPDTQPPSEHYSASWDPSTFVLAQTPEEVAPVDEGLATSQVGDHTSQQLLNVIYEPSYGQGTPGGHHLSHSPFCQTATPPASTVSQIVQNPGARLDILRSLQQHLMSSPWVLNNLPEPAVQPNDPLVGAGVLKPWRSRFDAFIDSSSSRYICQFFVWENMRCCSESNYRRDRLRLHLLSHFSYTPYPCEGKCGKSNCVMAFADNGILTEHIRRSLRPRIPCEFCDLEISQQNYRRHLTLKHSEVAGE